MDDPFERGRNYVAHLNGEHTKKVGNCTLCETVRDPLYTEKANEVYDRVTDPRNFPAAAQEKGDKP